MNSLVKEIKMTTIKITKEQQKKYILNPNICPFCDKSDISAGYAEFQDDVGWRDVRCYDCDAQWTEGFNLTEINNAFRKED